MTFSSGYLKVPLDRARVANANWLKQWVDVGPKGFVQQSIATEFPEMLRTLEPLVMIGCTRQLLVRCRGDWTAYFDNSARGTDAPDAISYLCRQLACDGIAIRNKPHTARGRKGIAGSVMFEYFGPRQTHFLNYVRSIAASHDGNKWLFTLGGQPQPFEILDAYKARSVRDRFTGEMLARYCEALGVSPYDESFYEPEAVLFEQTAPVSPPNVAVTLAQARAWLGLRTNIE